MCVVCVRVYFSVRVLSVYVNMFMQMWTCMFDILCMIVFEYVRLYVCENVCCDTYVCC